MVSKVETYRGYDIYRWEPLESPNTHTYPEFSASGIDSRHGSLSAARTSVDRTIEPRVVPVYDPVRAGGGSTKEFVENYRGVNIYQYRGTATNYTCKYGSSTSKSGVKYLIDQNLDEGAPPDIMKPTPDIYKDVVAAEEVRTEEPTQVQATPKVVDTYQGVDVVYHPDTDLYVAKVGDVEKPCEDMDAAHAFIDHEQYTNSPMYQAEKDRIKAEQDEELRRAFLSEEEARKEEEAKEAETKGGWFSIFWFKLKSELRETLEMLGL